ncbi:hypothetical protein [Gracilibacillus saliphilus]|uniref:hypothetical protein n=1 Tax=Gracilibacillus saliphilus TaxID=543890 RepID=UPI0013CFD6C2|nr:hypothetical protein [Gracilibacillus saliphilus]
MNLTERNIVYIGNQTIHQIFSRYLQQISEHIILWHWWSHFLTKHYEPIERTCNWTIDPKWSLKEVNQKAKGEDLTVPLVFDKVVQVLFKEFENEQYRRKTFTVQGKGHIDWHYEIHKKSWKNKSQNILVSLYFIWDMNRFSLVIKSSPYKYKPKNKLSSEEYQYYMTSKKLIKNKLKDNHHLDWQFTNYYLQIGNLKDINELTIEKLNETMTRTINLTCHELDQIFFFLENNL